MILTIPTTFTARRLLAVVLAPMLLFAAPALAQAPAFESTIEEPEDFPDHPGREETFYACIACHSFQVVARQGMSRERWDETLTWMTERHGMMHFEGEERAEILDYLETAFPPRAPAQRGFRNPFAPQ